MHKLYLFTKRIENKKELKLKEKKRQNPQNVWRFFGEIMRRPIKGEAI